jgi:membrane protein DedA with SNARE-associated domain
MSAQSHSLARNSLFIALGFPVGNWLAAPFTLLGVTLQNWMLVALAIVLVWIVLVRLTRP